MTLQDLGNIGEFVAAIAVIVSLLYLAAQIRQNSRLLRSSAFQAAEQSAAHSLGLIAGNSHVAKLLRVAQESYQDLNEDEKLQAHALFMKTFAGYEALFYQYRDGAIDPDLWEGRRKMMLTLLAVPGYAAWWRSWRYVFGQQLQDYVHRELASAPDIPLSE